MYLCGSNWAVELSDFWECVPDETLRLWHLSALLAADDSGETNVNERANGSNGSNGSGSKRSVSIELKSYGGCVKCCCFSPSGLLYVCACIYVYEYIYIQICVCVYTHIQICVYAYVDIRIYGCVKCCCFSPSGLYYMCACIYVYGYVHIQIWVYKYVYIYTYTNMCMWM